MESKKCSRCKTLRPMSGFDRNASYSDGRAYQCKVCCKVIDMFRKARTRAKAANVPFTITKGYLEGLIAEYGQVCPALGTPFQPGVGRPIPESMSIDRFEPRLGYVPGNVWLLSNRANTIKNSATRTELGRVYRWMCDVIARQEKKP